MNKLRILLISLLATMSWQVWAYDFEVDGIFYNYLSKSGSGVEVTYESKDKNYSGDVTIPSSVTYSGTEYTVYDIGDYAFQNCDELTSVTLPKTVTSIGAYAFQKCTGLTSITMPSVRTIDEYAFESCSSLTTISLSSNLTSIGECAFSSCTGLTSVSIPSKVTSIGIWAFMDCSSLTTVSIPSSVTSIAYRAFFNCTSLTSFDVDASNANYCSVDGVLFNKDKTTLIQCPAAKSGAYEIPDGVTDIESAAFYFCKTLTSVSIPEGVTTINDSTFYACTGITSLSLPDGLISTGICSFSYLINLTELNIPNSVKTIGNYSFMNSQSLTEVIIPDGVEKIGTSAFDDAGLTSVTIPNSVVSIDSWAFYCSSLTKVVSYIVEPFTISSGTFTEKTYENATLYVPSSEITRYKKTKYWSEFANIDSISESVPTDSNTLCLIDTVARCGSQIVMPVNLTNNEEMSGFQFDLYLPKGISVALDEDSLLMADLTSRATGFTWMGDQLTDSTYRFLVYPQSKDVMTGTEGAVMTLTLDISEDVAAGDYELRLVAIVLTTETEKSIKIDETKNILTVEDFLLGDVNVDGVVNVTDVVLTARHLLDKELETFVEKAADMNSDGEINVTDLVAIARLILKNQTSSSAKMFALSNDCLTLTNNHANEFTLSLNNTNDYTAFQADLQLPSGAEIESISLGNRCNDHTLLYNKVGDGHYRVLVYSQNISAIEGSEGALLNIKTSGTNGKLTASDALFTTTDVQTMKLAAQNFDTTGIDAIESNEATAERYFDLNGRYVGNDFSQLEKGIYVKNGKKFIKK